MTDIAYGIDAIEQDGGLRPMLADVSRAIVRLHKELYGRGPTKARSHLAGDVLLCMLGDGFTRAEITLLSAGRGDLVDHQRSELQRLVRDRFTSTIESITGRSVLGYMSATDEQAQLCCEIFVLEPNERASLNGDLSDAVRAGPPANGDRPR